MNSKFKTFIIFGIIVILLAVSYFAYGWLSKNTEPETNISVQATESAAEATDGEQAQEEEEQTKAADFSVQNSEGETVTLSDYFGKPIVLNFWASWCSPCQNEMPELQIAYEEYGEDVVFLMVNMTDGSRETTDSASEFIQEKGYTFPIFFDVDQDAAYAYSVSSIPMTVFIDAQGYMVAYANGSLDESTLRQGIGMIYSQ